MKVVTPSQMSEIDRISIEEYGIPGIVLMENAALAVVDKVISIFDGRARGKKVVIAAGKGNNGGDGFAVARHLFNIGVETLVFLAARKENIKGDALTNLNILDRIGVPVYILENEQDFDLFSNSVTSAHIVIDAIFGTGFKGIVKGTEEKMIEIINNSSTPVLAVDIPSGINGETGRAEGIHINASWTVTFRYPKVGLIVYPGCEACGELTVADIGFAREAVNRVGVYINTVEKEYLKSCIPPRFNESNKGTYGKVLIISGSPGMTGSGAMTAMSSLRSGAGLVYLAVPRSLINVYAAKTTEPVLVPLEDEGTGYLSARCCESLEEALAGKNVVAAGPGLFTGRDIFHVVRTIIELSPVPVVLDADALNVLAGNTGLLRQLKAGGVITPHPGEMSRLTGLSVQHVQENRIKIACSFAKEYNIVTVLKGFRTVIAMPDGRVYINLTGNPGMATAGTGDVLTGIISGFIAQGVAVEDAALLGVYLHGLAGDIAAGKIGFHGLLATDIIEEIPQGIMEIAAD